MHFPLIVLQLVLTEVRTYPRPVIDTPLYVRKEHILAVGPVLVRRRLWGVD